MLPPFASARLSDLPPAQREQIILLAQTYDTKLDDLTLKFTTWPATSVRIEGLPYHVPLDVTRNGAVRSVIEVSEGEAQLP